MSSHTPSNVCTCIYHQNFFLALDAIHSCLPGIPSYSTSFPDSCLHDPESDSCWFNECTHDDCGFSAKYPLPYEMKNKEAKWFRWQEVNGRLSKLEERGNVVDLYDYICTIAPKFLRHCHIKRLQAKQYELDKKLASAKESKIGVLQMDFAENYSCVVQDEIQSAHWNQNQVTLFTTVAWFKGTIDSQVIVSDFMEHTKKAVVPFLDEVLKVFPPGIEEVRVWIDGPSSQFKNRFVKASIKTLTQRRGINLCWNFSATSHGNGPVNGIGGCLKRGSHESENGKKIQKVKIFFCIS